MRKGPHVPTALALLAAAIACVFPLAADAQQPTQAQANAIRQSCRSDYQAHCASVPTGGTAALQCLQSNVAKLSPACQQAVGATTGAATSGAPAGTAQPPAAPPAAAAQPRPAPAPALTPRQEAALMRQSCGPDFRAFCRGVPLGGGRAISCLADHQENLSSGCRNALAAARGAR
jgi:hypothetical protein